MSIYKESLIRLHQEYTQRTFVGLLGRQATLLRLLADSYEVRLCFENMLETIQQGPTFMEDDDVDYLEWGAPRKWVKPRDLSGAKISTRKAFGLDDDDQFDLSYANRMKDAFGERIDNIDINRLHPLMYGVITSKSVIPDSEFELAIDGHLQHLRETLLEIYRFKNEKIWRKSDYAAMYKNFRDVFLNSKMEAVVIERQHQEWLKFIVTEPEKEDYYERRREILISLFKTGFLDMLKKYVRVLPDDEMGFGKIEDAELMPDLNDTLKYYAAFKRLCPFVDGKFNMDNEAAMGQYIHSNNISKVKCWSFLQHLALLKIVQDELEWLDNPDARPVNNDEVMKDFVATVKQIMLKAEDRNGEVILDKDNRGNEFEFTYNINGKRFCQVIDHIKENNPELLSDYIDGRNKANALGVTCVAPFIGAVLRTNIFSVKQIRYKDVEFAFQFVMGEKNKNGSKISYIQKMGIKDKIDDQSIFTSLKSIEKELP